MFFSTTDRAGRILSGNDVFARVSGYARDTLIGQPHNLIRHPDMPRTVFKLLWEHLLGGRPLAALVKNLASDGRHYWVVAFLMPLREGFLSIRFKPSSSLQPVVAAVYAEMLALEQQQEAAGADRPGAMRTSEEHLRAVLRARGFDSYETFMRVLLCTEMKSRDVELAAQHLALFPGASVSPGDASAEAALLDSIQAQSTRAYEQLSELYAQLDDFVALNDSLAAKSRTVLEQTGDFRFIAFNAALRSSRLGEEARGLGIIAQHLGITSDATTDLVRGLAGRIETVSGQLRAVIFNLAAARLQIEMILSFCAELRATVGASAAGPRDVSAGRQGMIVDLQQAFTATVQRTVAALGELEAALPQLGATTEDLRRNVLTLQVAQVGGMVEASRLLDDDSFAVMFADLRVRVEATKRELAELNDISGRLTTLASRAPAIAALISEAMSGMEREVTALAEIAGSTGPAPSHPDVPPISDRDGAARARLL